MASFYAQYPVVGGSGGGSGDVTGPGSSVAGSVALFADTSGKVLTDSQHNLVVDNISGITTVAVLAVGNNLVVTDNVPGIIINKFQVYDSNGNAIGFVPLYDDIT